MIVYELDRKRIDERMGEQWCIHLLFSSISAADWLIFYCVRKMSAKSSRQIIDNKKQEILNLLKEGKLITTKDAPALSNGGFVSLFLGTFNILQPP
jgi:hypothetical protein